MIYIIMKVVNEIFSGSKCKIHELHNMLVIKMWFFDIPYGTKFWWGESFGESGKTNIICQYFTRPNYGFTEVAR